MPLPLQSNTQSNPGTKPKRGSGHGGDKSHSHVSNQARSTPPPDRGRSHSPSSTSSNEVSSKHSYGHGQYGTYVPHYFIPSPAFSNMGKQLLLLLLLLLFVFGTVLLFTGGPFHPSSALGHHTLYSVPSFQTNPHPPGSVPTGSHPIGQIASMSREHMNMYRGLCLFIIVLLLLLLFTICARLHPTTTSIVYDRYAGLFPSDIPTCEFLQTHFIISILFLHNHIV